MKTLVIIPAKDEAQKIFSVVKEVRDAGYDVLVVDDGSNDQTGLEAEKAGAIVLKHLLNRGQGAALKTGIGYAAKYIYDVVVFFDADGQMAAVEIKNLLMKLTPDCEVVLGSRFLGRAVNIDWPKLLTLKLARLFTRLTTGLKLSDAHNGFQVWRLDALKKINLQQDRQAYASELISEIKNKKLKYVECPVTINYTDYSKKKGQSIFNAFNILWDLIVKK